MSPLLLIFILLLFAAFLYWQLVLAEGVYFGKRVVTFLYDITAKKYNNIKQYSAKSDAEYLGLPLIVSLHGTPSPLVLDVATGTSRLPLTLFQQKTFRGRVVALDNARKMLHEATRYVSEYRDRLTWVWHDSVPLPFNDNSFDAVTCLEALEFMPSTIDALRECVRVLKPGGLLVTSNRIASGRWQMPGKTYSKEKFEELLRSIGQSDIATQTWQVDYDLVWSIKPDRSEPLRSIEPIDALHCPRCQTPLQLQAHSLVCTQQHRYKIADDGVVELVG